VFFLYEIIMGPIEVISLILIATNSPTTYGPTAIVN
jgi:hypothetical protein